MKNEKPPVIELWDSLHRVQKEKMITSWVGQLESLRIALTDVTDEYDTALARIETKIEQLLRRVAKVLESGQESREHSTTETNGQSRVAVLQALVAEVEQEKAQTAHDKEGRIKDIQDRITRCIAIICQLRESLKI